MQEFQSNSSSSFESETAPVLSLVESSIPTGEIRTKRLRIRAYRQADGADVVAGLNQLAVSRWLSKVPHPFTPSDLRLTGKNGESRWPHAAAIEADGVLIGGISGGAQLGYWLVPELQGQGVGSEAAHAMVAYSMQSLKVDVMDAGLFEGNIASERILEKLGFEAVERSQVYCEALKRERPAVKYQLYRENWTG